MEKRGQFFLIAALVIAAVLLGTGIVFTQARAQLPDQSASALADEMRDEIYELISRDAYHGNSSEHTWLRIEGLVQNYSLSNPSNSIVIIYGNMTRLYATSYKKGVSSQLSSGLTYDASKITLTYDSIQYIFLRRIGIDYHILVKKEGDDGKTIAIR
ncbi:hypothetical protein FJZ18_04705 [Candidatus Pacearchaeota archaeon]|nr:hypothetical protein [Candidatus Pacearchaeota archaeon]